jgi:hypothetical protein
MIFTVLLYRVPCVRWVVVVASHAVVDTTQMQLLGSTAEYVLVGPRLLQLQLLQQVNHICTYSSGLCTRHCLQVLLCSCLLAPPSASAAHTTTQQPWMHGECPKSGLVAWLLTEHLSQP